MKSDINRLKIKLREQVSESKRKYSAEELQEMSQEVLAVLEITGKFGDARKICIYNAMAGEVETRFFVDKWMREKEFYFPVVDGQDIVLRKVAEDTVYEKSPIGVYEPVGENFQDYKKLDLIVVPGVAFDRQCNRLGRGKGYYDRFLAETNVHKIGICFDFQLFDSIPVAEYDVKMDMIVSENDLIW